MVRKRLISLWARSNGVEIGGPKGNFTVNGVQYTPPALPLLLQILSGTVDAQSYLPKGTVYTLPRNKLVEISVPGDSPLSPVSILYTSNTERRLTDVLASIPLTWGEHTGYKSSRWTQTDSSYSITLLSLEAVEVQWSIR